MRGVFVTGTDTGIGKTVVAATLVSAFRRDRAVGYWKPIQTGIESDDDTAEVAKLANCAAEEICEEGIRLERPLSPHLSARLAGRQIRVADLVEMKTRLALDRFWVIEGAGGLLVPLNDQEMMADLIRVIGLPVVVAARSGLGTINHTLLTVEALRRRDIDVAGVVAVGEPNPENRQAIETYGQVRVLAEAPKLSSIDPDTIELLAAAWPTDWV